MTNIKKYISEQIKKHLTFPYHAHVTGIANYSTGKEDAYITGYGKTKEHSENASLATHRCTIHGHAAKYYEHQPIDHDDKNDVEAHTSSKYDNHYRLSQKAHDHLHSIAPEVGNASHSRREGYELTGDAIKHLKFDHKNKTISHISEH
jgi:hypothetical protein